MKRIFRRVAPKVIFGRNHNTHVLKTLRCFHTSSATIPRPYQPELNKSISDLSRTQPETNAQYDLYYLEKTDKNGEKTFISYLDGDRDDWWFIKTSKEIFQNSKWCTYRDKIYSFTQKVTKNLPNSDVETIIRHIDVLATYYSSRKIITFEPNEKIGVYKGGTSTEVVLIWGGKCMIDSGINPTTYFILEITAPTGSSEESKHNPLKECERKEAN